jgi:hypothetical protein
MAKLLIFGFPGSCLRFIVCKIRTWSVDAFFLAIRPTVIEVSLLCQSLHFITFNSAAGPACLDPQSS